MKRKLVMLATAMMILALVAPAGADTSYRIISQARTNYIPGPVTSRSTSLRLTPVWGLWTV